MQENAILTSKHKNIEQRKVAEDRMAFPLARTLRAACLLHKNMMAPPLILKVVLGDLFDQENTKEMFRGHMLATKTYFLKRSCVKKLTTKA